MVRMADGGLANPAIRAKDLLPEFKPAIGKAGAGLCAEPVECEGRVVAAVLKRCASGMDMPAHKRIQPGKRILLSPINRNLPRAGADFLAIISMLGPKFWPEDYGYIIYFGDSQTA